MNDPDEDETEPDSGCDTTKPLGSDHPSGPGLEGPMPDPDDEDAWENKR
jgi:hypothetical protein